MLYFMQTANDVRDILSIESVSVMVLLLAICFYLVMNKKYCTGTRVAVVSLIVMNVLNIFYLMFKLNGSLYDIFILILSILIIVVIKII